MELGNILDRAKQSTKENIENEQAQKQQEEEGRLQSEIDQRQQAQNNIKKKQERLSAMSLRKEQDEDQINQIRLALKTGSAGMQGKAELRRELNKIVKGSEGFDQLSEEEQVSKMQAARKDAGEYFDEVTEQTKQAEAVEDKLQQRSQKTELKTDIEQIDAESEQLNKEIEEDQEQLPELSPEAQARLDQEQNNQEAKDQQESRLEQLQKDLEDNQSWLETSKQTLDALYNIPQQYDSGIKLWQSLAQKVEERNYASQRAGEASNSLEVARRKQALAEQNLSEAGKGWFVNKDKQQQAQNGLDQAKADVLRVESDLKRENDLVEKLLNEERNILVEAQYGPELKDMQVYRAREDEARKNKEAAERDPERRSLIELRKSEVDKFEQKIRQITTEIRKQSS